MEVLSYREARNLIKDGDVVFVRNRGTVIHHLISLITRSVHVHVGIAFWTKIGNEDHLMMIEAERGAKRKVLNLSYYQDHDLDVIVAPVDWIEIQNEALSNIGQADYNWCKAIYIGISELFDEIFGVNLPKVEFPGEICSEYVAHVLRLNERGMSPSTLFLTLLDLGHNVRVHVRKKRVP